MPDPMTVAIGDYPWTRLAFDAAAGLPIDRFEPVHFKPPRLAFRPMCRNLKFDVSEMAVATYYIAKHNNAPFTAIPMFPVRLAPVWLYGRTELRDRIRRGNQLDLSGLRVGIRSYTATANVWARALLASEFGVALESVTWIMTDDEHVAAASTVAGPNLEYKVGSNLLELYEQGDVGAILDVRSGALPEGASDLVPDMSAREISWAIRNQIYPMNHTVVVKDDILQSDPAIASTIYRAFVRAKTAWMKSLPEASIGAAETELLSRRAWIGADPLPYGVNENLPTLTMLYGELVEQGVLPGPKPHEEDVRRVFVEVDLDEPEK